MRKYVFGGKNHLVISQGTEHHRPLDDAATEDFDVRLHHVVDNLKAPKLAREEAPILELLRKQMWSGQLQMGEDEAETSQRSDEGDNNVEHNGVDQGEAVDGEGDEEERGGEIEDGEPFVFLNLVDQKVKRAKSDKRDFFTLLPRILAIKSGHLMKGMG